jgi:hypothetical protein
MHKTHFCYYIALNSVDTPEMYTSDINFFMYVCMCICTYIFVKFWSSFKGHVYFLHSEVEQWNIRAP